MHQFIIAAYAMVAFYVMSCVTRDHKQGRPSATITVAFGWGVMTSASVMGVLLLLWAGAVVMGLGAPPIPDL